MIHYVSRKALNIENLGGETIEQLYREKLIENPADLYTLTKEQLLPLERMAEKSAQNILDGVEKSKEIPFEKVLYGIGIKHVGETVAKNWLKLPKYRRIKECYRRRALPGRRYRYKNRCKHYRILCESGKPSDDRASKNYGVQLEKGKTLMM